MSSGSTKKVEVNTGGVEIKTEGISVQLKNGLLTEETAERLISIEAEDEDIIQTDADVDVYTQIVAQSNPNVLGESLHIRSTNQA